MAISELQFRIQKQLDLGEKYKIASIHLSTVHPKFEDREDRGRE